MAVLVHDDDAASALGEQRADGRACGSAADHEHVAVGRGRGSGSAVGDHGTDWAWRVGAI
jgi:hypothetical protein